MKRRYIGIIAVLSVIVLSLASCDLFAPDLVLQVVDPSYTIIGTDVEIEFWLKNTGSERLENCKVQWYVDDTANGNPDVIEYDEITDWAPSVGRDLGVGVKKGPFYAQTSEKDFSGGVDFFGIYAMGWDYSSD